APPDYAGGYEGSRLPHRGAGEEQLRPSRGADRTPCPGGNSVRSGCTSYRSGDLEGTAGVDRATPALDRPVLTRTDSQSILSRRPPAALSVSDTANELPQHRSGHEDRDYRIQGRRR